MDVVEVQQFVGNGVDGESGCRVDLKFVGDVAAVGSYGVHGEEERIGYFLVAHAFGNAADDVLFPFAQGFRLVFHPLNVQVLYDYKTVAKILTKIKNANTEN